MPTCQRPSRTCAGLGAAPLPAEAPRAFLHAGDELARRVGDVLLRIALRLVAPAQLDRVDPQFVRQLVDRAFEHQHARRLARRAAGVGRRQIERHRAVPRQAVPAGIERAAAGGGRFAELLARRAVRPGLVRERAQPAVAAGAEPHPLDGVAAVRGEVEHLLARQRRLHRPTQLARRQRAQDRVREDRQLAAEAAADVAADDSHLLRCQHQRVGHPVVRAVDELRRAVHRHPVAVPPGEARMRLHLRMDLHRRGVGAVEAHLGRLERRPEIADRAVGLGAVGRLGLEGPVQVGFERVIALMRLVVDLHQPRGGARLLEGLGDDVGRRLAVVMHPVVGQARQRPREAVVAFGGVRCLRRRVAVRHHQQHARCALGFGSVDGDDVAAGDGGLDDEAVGGRRGALAHFVGIWRRARHLQAAVDAVGRAADLAVAVVVERVRRRRLVHLHGALLRRSSKRLRPARPPARAARAGS